MSARRSTRGVVLDERRKEPVFALRFRAYGRRQYVTLGTAAQGWTQAKAEEALRHQLGHTDPAFTLRVYRHGMRRDEASKQALRELVGLVDRAAAGSNVVAVEFGATADGVMA